MSKLGTGRLRAMIGDSGDGMSSGKAIAVVALVYTDSESHVFQLTRLADCLCSGIVVLFVVQLKWLFGSGCSSAMVVLFVVQLKRLTGCWHSRSGVVCECGCDGECKCERECVVFCECGLGGVLEMRISGVDGSSLSVA